MSSKAFRRFKKNVIDVRRLNQNHNTLSSSNPGRRGLGHITRSSVVMLCASWERYVEDVLIEATRYIINKSNTPKNLPLSVQKHLSKKVKDATHELKPLELAGDGWEQLLDTYCCEEVRALHTPKHGKLKNLYRNYIGLEDIEDLWSVCKTDIDDFVSLRGHIAHNGRDSHYITIYSQKTNTQMVYDNCLHMDNKLCDYLHTLVGGSIQPWRKVR